jgi:3alpha(or 20beta)-hydroxysteroid dehydrogenase
MTKVAALDFAPYGVRVNSVHPGAIDTPMLSGSLHLQEQFFSRIPLGRIGNTDEVSGMVVFLISDESSFCTGAEFVVDGGQTCQQ